MHETSMPLVLPATSPGTLGDLPLRLAAERPERVAFSQRHGDGWRDVTSATFAAEVTSLAKGFVAAGVSPGDAVAILSCTRYEWTLTDFALWAAGAVPVPIYETSSPDQIAWILSDSGAVGVVVETERHLAAVDRGRADLPALRHTWVIDHGDLGSLARDGADVDDAELSARRDALDRDSLATVIYTSGTTGRPKGVELTHGNFLTLAENTAEEIHQVVKADGSSTLLFLPLAHVFARFIEVLAVPRVFEKVYNSAEATARAGGRGAVFATAAAVAVAWSQAQDAGSVPLGLRLRHAVFDRLVYRRLRDAMGGDVRYAVSGGAPLGTRLGHFFRGIGVTILEGYGLTETTAPATVNRPDAMKIGTVGQPLPGVDVRIADDGEICLRGINVLRGYRGNPEATAEAVRDGWFHTGDLGELDDEGFLRITGRKKEILVTAGGKNVAPAVLEDRLRAHPLVSQCIVVGDGKPFIAALVTLDEEMYPGWAAAHGLDGLPFTKAKDDPRIRDEIQKAVDDANSAVSKAESIRAFAILDGDFTEESGHLTPSLKLKRNVVMRDFGDEVDALYGG